MSNSLIEKFKAGLNHRKTISVPGIEGEKIKLRILSSGEQQDAELDAELYYRKERNKEEVPVNTANYDSFEAEKVRQVLYRAISTLKDEPLCDSMSEFREIISEEQRELLSNEYLVYEGERSPIRSCQTDEEYDALIKDIKKKPALAILNIYDISLLKRVITTLVPEEPTSQ